MASLEKLLEDIPPLRLPPGFFRRDLISDEDIDILESMAIGRTAEQCNQLYWKATRRFGADKFASGEIDLKNRDRKVFYSMQWSETWRQFYLANFLQKDPLLAHLEHNDEPFTWRELQKSKKLTAEEQASFKLLAGHGWIDGFVFAIPRQGSHIALLSVVCREVIDAIRDKAFLTLLSHCYLERIRTVITARDFPAPPLGLGPRELECLNLVARGLGDREVGNALKISSATAHEHIQRAMKRIGVRSRSQAVAIAVAFGAIRL